MTSLLLCAQLFPLGSPSLHGAHWPQTWEEAQDEQRARLDGQGHLAQDSNGVSPGAVLGGAPASAI